MFVSCISSCLIAASNQGNRRNLLGEDFGGKKKKNNQAAQAAEQGKGFGLPGFGGINQAQAGTSGCTEFEVPACARNP
jgi:hypothetical protein